MSHAVSKEMVVAVSLKSFYELVIDYERYPEFVPGVKACRVRKVGKEKHVEYEVDLGIRKIRYTLRHAEEPPRRVSWSLVGGEMMKVSNGSLGALGCRRPDARRLHGRGPDREAAAPPTGHRRPHHRRA